MREKLTGTMAMGWNLGRGVHFAVQQRLFPLVEMLVTRKRPWHPEELKDKLSLLLRSEVDLLKRDANHIAAGIYPWEVLIPERPWTHGLRYLRILQDAYRVNSRKLEKDHMDFSPEAKRRLSHAPDYYKRNFHFQTDGYASDHSADLYDHQVDILFSGATDAMRRSILPPLKHGLTPYARLLEMGCGTGRLTRFASMTFPEGEIIAVDPSEPYLLAAKEMTKGLGNVRFKKAFAEKVKIEEGSFSGAYSCFLFHELPKSVRRAVMKKMIKAVEPNGLIVIVDSLQLGDMPEMDWALKRFPSDFHEPFYADYSKDKMELWTKDFPELRLVESSNQFLSKLVVFRRLDKHED